MNLAPLQAPPLAGASRFRLRAFPVVEPSARLHSPEQELAPAVIPPALVPAWELARRQAASRLELEQVELQAFLQARQLAARQGQ